MVLQHAGPYYEYSHCENQKTYIKKLVVLINLTSMYKYAYGN